MSYAGGSDLIARVILFRRYDTNVLGTKGPRKMTVIVPPVSDDGHVMATTEEGLLERVKQGEFGDCQKLHNKAPRWNESLGAYCLNFNGRVTLPSVKNFQLQLEGASDPNQVSLQFGKTGDSTFTMDYSYPLSPLQAFQVCQCIPHAAYSCTRYAPYGWQVVALLCSCSWLGCCSLWCLGVCAFVCLI